MNQEVPKKRDEPICSLQRNRKPTLATGETFYTNFPASGITVREQFVSLDDYLYNLRIQFETVEVKNTATDSSGHLLENDVAVFVGKRKQTTVSAA